MARVQLYGLGNDTHRLSEQETIDCFKKVKAGDKEARQSLVLSNLKLVLSLSQKYYNHKVDIQELFSAGLMGLFKAIDGFDLDYKVKFSTYAVPMISGEIRRVSKERMGIKVPRSLRDIAYRATVYKNKYFQEHLKNPNCMEIASEIGVNEEDVVMAFDAVSDVIYLYENIYSNEEDSCALIDQIQDDEFSEEKVLNSYLLKKAYASLENKEKKIIYLRYFERLTQFETSKILHISQAQVSRIEKMSIDKMRAYFE